jgi:hypothetical protein
MSVTIELSGDAEILAAKVARKRGLTIEQVVGEAIAESALKAGLLEAGANAAPETIVAALDELSRRHVSRPLLDARPADEIVGYDEFGAPQRSCWIHRRSSQSWAVNQTMRRCEQSLRRTYRGALFPFSTISRPRLSYSRGAARQVYTTWRNSFR